MRSVPIGNRLKSERLNHFRRWSEAHPCHRLYKYKCICISKPHWTTETLSVRDAERNLGLSEMCDSAQNVWMLVLVSECWCDLHFSPQKTFLSNCKYYEYSQIYLAFPIKHYSKPNIR